MKVTRASVAAAIFVTVLLSGSARLNAGQLTAHDLISYTAGSGGAIDLNNDGDGDDLGEDIGSLVTGFSDTFAFNSGFPPYDQVGTLFGEVFSNGSEYTYVLTVNPTYVGTWTRLVNQGPVYGFNDVMGYQHADATAAGIEDGFTAGSIPVNGNVRLEWQVSPFTTSWTENEAITFFFQSTVEPTLGGFYTVVNGNSGYTQSYTPVPEPATLALIAVGFLGAFGFRRRRRSRARKRA